MSMAQRHRENLTMIQDVARSSGDLDLVMTYIEMHYMKCILDLEAAIDRLVAINQKENARLTELRALPYQDYLKTAHWQGKRIAALARADYRCSICNASDQQLDVHHRTYVTLGDEPDNDLIVLCTPCHYRFHEQVGSTT